MIHKNTKLVTQLLSATLLTAINTHADDSQPTDIYNIFKYPPAARLTSVTGNPASGSDEPGSSWTIYGSEQENNTIYRRPADGNGEKSHPRVLVVTEPISDKHILPFDKALHNTHKSDQISLTATPGEYEPASIVIRTGPQDLGRVTIKSSPLTSASGLHQIPADNVDLRIVKAWFQSSVTMRRTEPRRAKQLVPELLLHDNSLVQVDYESQTNIVRTRPELKDSKRLLPFAIPPHFNQQIWITIYVPETAEAGTYQGTLEVNAYYGGNEVFKKVLNISCEVLPFRLAEPEQLFGLFYLGRIADERPVSYATRAKTTEQMRAELLDMRRHGIRLVTLDHDYRESSSGKADFSGLAKQIKLLNETGLNDSVSLYVDWKVSKHESPGHYSRKLSALRNYMDAIGNRKELWIYNRDEKDIGTLLSSRHTFSAAHEIGAKNIVALTNTRTAKQLRGQLDIAILQHKTPSGDLEWLVQNGIRPLAYGLPHAGEERPATTRSVYGLMLAKRGFHGTISYAYQSGDCWDDWMKWKTSSYRPNVMAYPTASEPVPTLQWEAMREGVDDLSYLAKYRELLDSDPRPGSSQADIMTTYNGPSDSQKTRQAMILEILGYLKIKQ